MWKVPLEFEGALPSKPKLLRRSKRTVKTPLIPKVKSSQKTTKPWVSPQFDNVMVTQAKKEKQRKSKNGTKTLKTVSKRSPLAPLPVMVNTAAIECIEDKQITEIPQQQPKSKRHSRHRQMKLNFASVQKNMQECPDDSPLQSVNCASDISSDSWQDQPISLQYENPDFGTSHQLTFNPALCSTPCNVDSYRKSNTMYPSTIQTLSHNSTIPSDSITSVLALDTPSPLLNCGLRCRLKKDCRHARQS